MRQLTVTIPDDFYETFISFFKHIPDVSIDENVENEIPLWQQEMPVTYRAYSETERDGWMEEVSLWKRRSEKKDDRC